MAQAPSPTAMQRSRSHLELGDKTLIKAKPVTISNRVLGASQRAAHLPHGCSWTLY